MEQISIDKETAELEFSRLCENWHIDLDDTEESKGLRDSLISNLKSGHLVIKEQGEGYKLVVEQHLREGIGKDEEKNIIVHKFVRVKELVVLDGIKNDANMKRMIAAVSATTREAQPIIMQLISKDLYTGFWVSSLFLLP